jgi:hypothetical protein
VRAWKTRFTVRYLAPILSHNSLAVVGQKIRSSHNRVWIHNISAIALAIALYSTSVLDRETVFCFLALHDIRFVPRKMAQPPVDLLSSRDPAQSTSENPLINSNLHFLIFKPTQMELFRYLSIRFIATQYAIVGA